MKERRVLIIFLATALAIGLLSASLVLAQTEPDSTLPDEEEAAEIEAQQGEPVTPHLPELESARESASTSAQASDAASPAADIFFEDFEGSFPPTGWDRASGGDGYDWERNDTFGAPNQADNYGSGFSAAADADDGPTGNWDAELWSPPITLPVGGANLSFASNFQDFAGNGDAWLSVSTDGGTNWTGIFTQTTDDAGGTTGGGVLREFDLSAYGGETIRLRWRYAASDSSAWFWHIDNVRVSEPAPDFEDSTKSAPALAELDDSLTYTVYIENSGNLTATGANMVDPIPAHTTYISGSVSASSGTASYDGGTNAVLWNGSLAPGEAATVTFGVDLAVSGPVVAISNTAVISDPLAAPVNVTAQTTIARPDFAPSSKQATPIVSQGELVEYAVYLRNNGPLTASNASMVDPIPMGTVYASGSLSASTGTATYDDVTDAIYWNGSVDVGDVVTVTFAATATEYCGIVLDNTAVISDPIALAPTAVSDTTEIVNRQTSYFEDFEADDGGYVATNDWEWGTPTYPPGLEAFSGSNVWATVLDGPHNNLDDSSILSFDLDLTGTPPEAFLTWWQYLQANGSSFDFASVRVDGDTVYDSSVTGDDPEWTQYAVSLAPYVGSVVTVEFDFFATSVVNDDGWYIDDVSVYIDQCFADAHLDPESASSEQEPDTVVTRTVTISNPGTTYLDWEASFGPQGTALALDDGSQENGLVLRDPNTLIEFHSVIFNHFRPEDTTFPLRLEEIHIHQDTNNLQGLPVQLLIYQDDDATSLTDAMLMYTEVVTVQTQTGWNYYTLAEPVMITDPTNVLIGFSTLYADGGAPWPGDRFPYPMDEDEPIAGRSYAAWMDTVTDTVDVSDLTSFSNFEEIGVLGFPANWLIRTAGVAGCMNPPDWADLMPNTGSLIPGMTEPLSVILDSAGKMAGTYSDEMCLYSNARSGSPIQVPVTLTVGSPSITVAKTVGTDPDTCASESEISVPAGTTVYYCYTVQNTGDITLPLHTVVDDQLGTILTDFAYDLGPGEAIDTVAAGLVVSDVVDMDVTNTVTWTAHTGTDGGLMAEATDTATVNVGTKLYLPIVFR